MDGNSNQRELREFIRDHQVCWETRPITAILGDDPRQVGFELELRAVHGPSSHKPKPGCPECQRLFQELRKLAEAIFPHEHRPSRYEIRPFDHSFHLDPSRGFRPEVALRPEIVLRIEILDRKDYFQPDEACEISCLKEMEQSLKELGARKGRWVKLKKSRRKSAPVR